MRCKLSVRYAEKMYKITTSVLLVIVFLCNFCCAECVLKSDYDYITECYNDGSCKFIRNIVEKLCEILSTDLVKLNYAKVDVQNFCKKYIKKNILIIIRVSKNAAILSILLKYTRNAQL